MHVHTYTLKHYSKSLNNSTYKELNPNVFAKKSSLHKLKALLKSRYPVCTEVQTYSEDIKVYKLYIHIYMYKQSYKGDLKYVKVNWD